MNKGIISAISEDKITVAVQCQSACSKCTQHHVCSLEIKQKKVIIPVSNPQSYKIGQEVDLIIGKKSMALSLLFAYALPLFLSLIMLGLGVLNKWSDAKSGIIALLVLIPYYATLFFTNSLLKKHIAIEITENSVD